jgi:hypothetical protein
MDVDRVIAELDTLRVPELQRLRQAIEELYGHYEAVARPPEDTLAPERKYRLEWVLCGKPSCKKCTGGTGHGPYYYAYWSENGKTVKKYVGKFLPAGVDAAAVKG